MVKKVVKMLSVVFFALLMFMFSTAQVSAATDDGQVGAVIPGLGTVVDQGEDVPVEEYTEQDLIDIVEQPELKQLIRDGNFYFEDSNTLVIVEKPLVAQPQGRVRMASTNNVVLPGGGVKHKFTKVGSSRTTYGGWRNGIEGTGSKAGSTMTLSKRVSVSNSYSGSLAVSKGYLDAVVGYNTTATKETTASYTTTLRPGKKSVIQFRQVNKKQTWKQTTIISGRVTSTNNINTYKFSHLGYRTVEK